MKLLDSTAHAQESASPHTPDTLHAILQLANDADPRTLALEGIRRIDLHFPKFTDGRAYSQAFLLRRRLGFAGEIRATGDVLVDQLLQMQRCGFDSAVLREDQDLAVAQQQLARFGSFYQGDARTNEPAFARAVHPTGSAIARNAKPSNDYASKLATTQQTLRQAALDFASKEAGQAPRIVQASSLGAEDVVISHLINALALDIGTFVLDTGHLHAETLALLNQFKAQQAQYSGARAHVAVYKPQQAAVIAFIQREGNDAMYHSIELRKACCTIRKTEPLARALHGMDAWVTGLRREQSGSRADVPLVDSSEARTKINPLAEWTWGDVWHYIREHHVAYNPLHDAFFPSIGCQPCTRAIALGEDFRAGRWWWEDETAKECGLHVKASALPETAPL